jgi:hypothetical protein
VLSGTIKYQGLVLGIFFNPLAHLGWILSNSRGDFLAAPPPVSIGAYIEDRCSRESQARFNLMDGNP